MKLREIFILLLAAYGVGNFLYYNVEILVAPLRAVRMLFVAHATSQVDRNGLASTTSACSQPPTIRSAEHPQGSLHVVSTCNLFLDRVKQFSSALDLFRTEVLKERGNKDWNGTLEGINGTVRLVWGADDDFLEQLGTYSPHIRTLILPWLGDNTNSWSSLNDHSNLLLRQYYEWVADDYLCSWIQTPGKTQHNYHAIHSRNCNPLMNITAQPMSLRPFYLYQKLLNSKYYWPNNGSSYPQHFYERPPPYVFYVHIAKDAVVSHAGNIYARTVKFVPYSCKADRNVSIPHDYATKPVYDEVYVLAQFWSTKVFHRMLEIVPRLVTSLDFLKRNPQIKIVTQENANGRLGQLLDIVGIERERVITGMVRAKIAYIPRVTHCGFANLQEAQILSQIYHRHILENVGAWPRNKLILIRRTGYRHLLEQEGIEKVLKKLASLHELEFIMYIDNPQPSLAETMRMFHAAVMVVAPHGAGLSNLIFSQPGTYVIEGTCDLPYFSLCFQRTAIILSHHYHAVPSRYPSCETLIRLSADKVNYTASFYLEQRRGLLAEAGT